MTPALADRPRLMFDLDAPRARVAEPARPEPTLDGLMVNTWNGLAAHGTVPCPVCGGALAPLYGAGSAPVGGRCRDCDSTLG